MKILSWIALGAIGFGVMCFGYSERKQPGPQAAWAHGLILIGPPPEAGLALPGGATPVQLTYLSGNPRTEAILKGLAISLPEKAAGLKAQLQPKLIAVHLKGLAINETSLESGRLPSDQGGEVLAGPEAEAVSAVRSGETSFKVVGRLTRDFGLFERCYLAPLRDGEKALFSDDDDSRPAILLQLPAEKMRDPKILEQIDKAFPSSKYSRVAPEDRLDQRAFFTYLGGLALFLLGGSGALISIYGSLAQLAQGSKPETASVLDVMDSEAGVRRPWPNWLAAPLIELQRRPTLVWGLHIGYFGLVMAGAITVHLMPEIQTVLLSSVRDALTAQSGPLASAGKAYATRNVLHAAAVTFGVNYFLGTLLMITLPSFVVPGCGILLAITRSFLWGLLLAPTLGVLAMTMLPHSGTMLLEGAGYILATIFAVLIPIRIFESSGGGSLVARFGRAILLNIQGSFWVAVVLALAALYEATEVIAMMG